MLAYVIDACRKAGVQKLYIIVGYGKDQVIHYFNGDKDIVWVEQKEQKGTGHAVLCCKEHLENFDGDTLILCGDMPLIRSEIVHTLIDKHNHESAAATLATAILENTRSYGRIVRDTYGNIQGIVEDADCNPQQKAIKEVNPSYYCFKNKVLFEALSKVRPNNVKNEYYLTDALQLIIKAGYKVVAVTAVLPEDAIGVNSRQQLSEVGKIMQNRIQDRLMKNGVTIVDPPNTWIDARAQIGQDTVVEPFTYIHGNVKIGNNCRVGPFAYVREGTVLGNDVILGVFTEVKNSTLSDGVRARHHSYIGDAVLGKHVDIGAGAITANFDGQKIQQTEIGDNVFVGCGSVIVAPVKVPANIQIAPASAVTTESIKQK
jgi:bifunctional UDP-N-acetylglucosamine pyrophosphorylase/glucosamine-1-phosphate N-acetyltransferase